MDLFREWARRRYSRPQRLVALAIAGLLVAVLAPCLLIDVGLALDEQLGLGRLPLGVLGPVLGLALILPGLALALWSIQAQFTLAEGTPIPVMPTQMLVVVGPFAYCRNPMSLGTITACTGLALWVGSPCGFLTMIMAAILLLAYIKLIEERELEGRFGAEYLAYKRTTAFLIPRLPRGPRGSRAGPD